MSEIKTGIDDNGRPYIDMSDTKTVRLFLDQAPRFNKITLGVKSSNGYEKTTHGRGYSF